LVGGVLAVALFDGLLVELAAVLVDVAHREDLDAFLAEEAFDVVVAHRAHADVADAETLRRRLGSEDRGGDDHGGCYGRRGLQEVAPRNVLEHRSSVLGVYETIAE